MLLATSTSALGQDTEPSTSIFTVKDTVPAGFENLMQEQTLFVEVRFNEQRVGTFEVLADAENVLFSNPQKLVDSLDNVHKNALIVNALSSELATNSHLICYGNNEPVGCGLVEPSPAAIIFDENLLTLDLFLTSEFQLIQNVAIERYLPAAEKRGSSILAMNMLASDGYGQSSLDFTTRSRISYGAGHAFAEAEYNTRTETTRMRSMRLTHLLKDQEFTLGTFSYGTSTLLNNTEILGASLKSSFSTRIDLSEAFSSELIVYLTRGSLVQIFIDERVYLAQRYAGGNQTLDTSSLPSGTYEVEIRITDAIAGERSEFQLFTKSTQLPPRNQTLHNFTIGVPVKFDNEVFPERQNLLIGGLSVARRITDQSSWQVGIVNVGELALAEAQYLMLGENISFQAGIGAGNGRVNSGTFRLGASHKRTSGGLNARWFNAANTNYRESTLDKVLPRDVIQIDARFSHSFDNTSLSSRFSERITSNGTAQQQTSRRLTFSVRHALLRRGTMRANLQASYNRSNEGYKVTLGITGSWHRSKSSTNLSIDSGFDNDNENTLRSSLSHRRQSDLEASTAWSTDIRTSIDDLSETFGFSGTMENELASASISSDWTSRQNNPVGRTSTLKLGTRIAIDSKGLAMSGTRVLNSGMILDVSGEPRGEEYDIVVNGINRGTGKVGEKRFLGLDPLQKYTVQLLPKASLMSSMDETSFEFTVYPGAVKRLIATAQVRVLLIASLVTANGTIIDDGYIERDGNLLMIGADGILQIEATPSEALQIQRQRGSACTVMVPEATEDSDIAIPEKPLVCR